MISVFRLLFARMYTLGHCRQRYEKIETVFTRGYMEESTEESQDSGDTCQGEHEE